MKENTQKNILQEAHEIAQKVQTYFSEREKKEPLIAMDEQNRICKYYPNGEIEVLKDIKMNAQQQQTLNAIRQADAIAALENIQPTEMIRLTDKAVLAGRITFKQAADELRDYVAVHKTIDGFIQTRHWAME